MKKLILILLLFISGVSYSQTLDWTNQTFLVDTTNTKATFLNAIPESNSSVTFNTLVALDSFKVYGLDDYGDTTLQKFTMSTSDSLKTLLTGFSGVNELRVTDPTIKNILVWRVNAVLLSSTRSIRLRQRGLNIIR